MKLVSSFVLLFLCLTLFPRDGVAQSAPAPAAASVSQGTAAPTTAYTLPPDKLEKARTLYYLGGKLRIIGTAYYLLILLAILNFGVATRYRDWAEKAAKYRFVQALVFVPLLILTITVLQLPLYVYRHSIGLQYGLSVQHWGSWFRDVLLGEAISVAITTVAVWFVTNRIRKNPKRWWFHSWWIATIFVVFFIYITPIAIDPLFNKFESLDAHNPQLVDAIEKVTQ